MITDQMKLETMQDINFAGHIIAYETTDQNIASFEEIYKYYNT